MPCGNSPTLRRRDKEMVLNLHGHITEVSQSPGSALLNEVIDEKGAVTAAILRAQGYGISYSKR